MPSHTWCALAGKNKKGQGIHPLPSVAGPSSRRRRENYLPVRANECTQPRMRDLAF
ncbi:MAG: hypothetical protein U1E51_17535 [Candidatus Binatia bacterium]|nr:hypothetical protein [Candidatus Binatia bacterium]